MFFNVKVTRITLHRPSSIRRDGRWLIVDHSVIRAPEEGLHMALNESNEPQFRTSLYANDRPGTCITLAVMTREQVSELMRLWVLPEDFELSFS